MSQTTLVFGIEGPPEAAGRVNLDDFSDFCGNILACLRRVESKFPGLPKLKYQIVGLRVGSAVGRVRTVHDNLECQRGGKVLRLFSGTARRIQTGGAISKRFTGDDLRAFQKLATPLSRGAPSFRIGPTRITHKYVEHIETFLGESRTAHGSCKGVIEKINGHDRFEFTLFPAVGPRATCSYDKSLEAIVLKSFRRSVTVYGKVTYLPGHFFADRVVVNEIITHPLDSDLPKLSDLKGACQGMLGDKTSAEYVQAIRNG